ncbi:hypothetical protein OAF54_03485, partial [bacterium]|nr:hypothetical protein [bacterium]
YYFWGTGAFDDTGVGNGLQIALEVIGAERTERVEGFFNDHVYILGGELGVEGAGTFDWISLELLAPASVPVLQQGGNCHLINVGPGSIILPSDDGTHNIDTSAMVAGERNLNLTPVPNPTGTGYWDWDPTQTPSITPNPQAGAYDLYDFDITLGRQANRYPLLCPGSVTPTSSIKGKKILPHWKWSFVIYRKEAGTVKVAIRLATARKKTV